MNVNYLIGPYHQQDIVGITKVPFRSFAPPHQLLVVYTQSTRLRKFNLMPDCCSYAAKSLAVINHNVTCYAAPRVSTLRYNSELRAV